MESEKEILIFQHIPKTAGTTLSFIIARYFDKQDIYHIRNMQQLKGPSYSDHFGSLDDFNSQPGEIRNRFRCIMGHMPFGIHEYLEDNFRYITFIRDPVNRVLSQFGQYIRMIQNNELKGDKISLEEFVKSRPTVLNNHQTRFISGLNFNSYTTEACFERALENIEKYFSIVGVVERFDESLLLLSRLYHWQDISYVERNKAVKRISVSEFDPHLIERIREANRLDTALHFHAIKVLNEKVREQGEIFKKDLRIFKRKQSFDRILNAVEEKSRIPIRRLASGVGKSKQ